MIEFANCGRKTAQGYTLYKNVSFTLKKGKITALIGLSGDGKTSLMDAIVGLCRETHTSYGAIRVEENGEMVERDVEKWFDQIAYIRQHSSEYKRMTVKNILRSARVFCQTPKNEVDMLVAELRIQKTLNTMYMHLSGGEQKRVMLIVGMMLSKEVTVWDEPLSGLDSELAFTFMRMINKSKKTHLVSIHQMSEDLAKTVDEVIVMHKSTVVYSGALSDIDTYMANMGIKMPNSMFKINYIMRMCAGNAIEEGDEQNIHKFNALVSKAEREGEQSIDTSAKNVYLTRPKRAKIRNVLEIVWRSLWFNGKIFGLPLWIDLAYYISTLYLFYSTIASMFTPVGKYVGSNNVLEIEKQFVHISKLNTAQKLQVVKGMQYCNTAMFVIVMVIYIFGKCLISSLCVGEASYYKLCKKNIEEKLFTTADLFAAFALESVVRYFVMPVIVMLVLIAVSGCVKYAESGSAVCCVSALAVYGACLLFMYTSVFDFWKGRWSGKVKKTVITNFLFVLVLIPGMIAIMLPYGIAKYHNMVYGLSKEDAIAKREKMEKENPNAAELQTIDIVLKALNNVVRVGVQNSLYGILSDLVLQVLAYTKCLPERINSKDFIFIEKARMYARILNNRWKNRTNAPKSVVDALKQVRMSQKLEDSINSLLGLMFREVLNAKCVLHSSTDIEKTIEYSMPLWRIVLCFVVPFAVPLVALLLMSFQWYRVTQPKLR